VSVAIILKSGMMPAIVRPFKKQSFPALQAGCGSGVSFLYSSMPQLARDLMVWLLAMKDEP